MIRKRFAGWRAFLTLIIFLSGCAVGQRSETIIIPSTEAEHTSDSGSKPFKVKTIYRLPILDAKDDSLLGWADSESVIGVFQDASGADRTLTQSIQRFPPPYEQPEMMRQLDIGLWNLVLSPNGKFITGFKKAQDSVEVKLISLSDGQEKNIAAIKPRQELLSAPAWSDNGKYISYLFTDADEGHPGTEKSTPKESAIQMAVYDTIAGQAKRYPLKGFQIEGSVSAVKMSDDGQSVVIVWQKNVGAVYIGMGTISGDAFQIQYENEARSDQAAWLNKDQFVFLGTEGTLYEYDRRNAALSVLLERVLGFRLSQDRKHIAYFQKVIDDISIFAGKLQGNNVLYNESVYQGVLPSRMDWSPQNDSLLINGRKIYSTANQKSPEPSPDSYNQSFIIKFQ
ncbi:MULTISPECIES: hypothetical protein [Paenibacillus]|uniref:WD40 repeat domain-containing protein n=1 Tax=Paenibacillus albilobatus TaxID=2716884 RepID=A0A920CEF8_9BACL|nr:MULTISPECIES: hypothetical protein [Paenibacillus]GIO34798.1 hypothetical protein J2TS6_59390 [Paenibacillus albilobatus]